MPFQGALCLAYSLQGASVHNSGFWILISRLDALMFGIVTCDVSRFSPYSPAQSSDHPTPRSHLVSS